jgi:hypothetical protein
MTEMRSSVKVRTSTSDLGVNRLVTECRTNGRFPGPACSGPVVPLSANSLQWPTIAQPGGNLETEALAGLRVDGEVSGWGCPIAGRRRPEVGGDPRSNPKALGYAENPSGPPLENPRISAVLITAISLCNKHLISA